MIKPGMLCQVVAPSPNAGLLVTAICLCEKKDYMRDDIACWFVKYDSPEKAIKQRGWVDGYGFSRINQRALRPLPPLPAIEETKELELT